VTFVASNVVAQGVRPASTVNSLQRTFTQPIGCAALRYNASSIPNARRGLRPRRSRLFGLTGEDTRMAHVLIVDDEEGIRAVLARTFPAMTCDPRKL